MNCETFRHAVGADPATTHVEVLEHAASCPECARYRTEMLALNGLIHRALQIDVAAQPLPIKSSAPSWRIAAMVLVSVMVFSIGWLAYPRASLAEQVVAHALHEKELLVRTDERAAREEVRDVLNRAGVFLNREDLQVSAARLCPLGKQRVPHLVVQTEAGPVTVLVMPYESTIKQQQRFEEQGFVGTFVPAPRGVIAVLARDAAVDEIAAKTLSALRYDAR